MKLSLSDLLPKAQANVLLAPYTTFHIGGPAKFLFTAHTKEDIREAVKAAQKVKLPFFILAGGSNLLISDQDFPGLVIHVQNTRYKIQDTNLYAEAGVQFPAIVEETGERGLAGLEWAGGLPGTVGGAIRGNAGAFKGEVKDNIIEVEALDQNGNIKRVSRRQCQFSYRSSIFKKKDWVVLSATFALQKGDRAAIQGVAQDHIRYRQERHPLEYPNAGSIFKNVDLKKLPKQFHKEVEQVVKIDPFPVVPTAYLIAQAGLKGLRVGDAQVSEKHPNYIVNLGHAKSKDVLLLIEKVKQRIKEKYKINLEMEVEYVE